MESIVKAAKSCFFCGSEKDLERHHIYMGLANRKLSEEDGLWVWLCPKCHRGDWGVHGYHGHEYDLALKRAGEWAWVHHTGGTIEDFRKRYGKNYI